MGSERGASWNEFSREMPRGRGGVPWSRLCERTYSSYREGTSAEGRMEQLWNRPGQRKGGEIQFSVLLSVHSLQVLSCLKKKREKKDSGRGQTFQFAE